MYGSRTKFWNVDFFWYVLRYRKYSYFLTQTANIISLNFLCSLDLYGNPWIALMIYVKIPYQKKSHSEFKMFINFRWIDKNIFRMLPFFCLIGTTKRSICKCRKIFRTASPCIVVGNIISRGEKIFGLSDIFCNFTEEPLQVKNWEKISR